MDSELDPTAPLTDLHSLRATDPCLDTRAQRIQDAAALQAAAILNAEEPGIQGCLCAMRGVLVTGAAGYLGCPLVRTLQDLGAKVVGLDVVGGPSVHVVGSVADSKVVSDAAAGCEAEVVMNTAALHAPHATSRPESEYEAVNVQGVRNVLGCGAAVVHTSTTSHTITQPVKELMSAGECIWFDHTAATAADHPPARNKYGRTKRIAEHLCLSAAEQGLDVVVLRTSRFFCEDALESSSVSLPNLMVNELLGRRVGLVDVIVGHVKALLRVQQLSGAILTLSAPWPWAQADTPRSAEAVADLAKARWGGVYNKIGWVLPDQILRVYDSSEAVQKLEWKPWWTFEHALELLEKGNSEVKDGLF